MHESLYLNFIVTLEAKSWMRRNFIYGILLVTFAILTYLLAPQPQPASACACCVDQGTWDQYSQEVGDYELKTFNELQFASQAELYMTPAGASLIEGLGDPSPPYTLSRSTNGRNWNFQFTDDQGRTGNLSFSYPLTVTHFRSSLGSQLEGQVDLYKEYRAEGKLSGNGIFAPGITDNTQFKLILQSRGNKCMSSEQFESWRLNVSGSEAEYAFYGSLT